jgi:hydroxypyruvate reductase
MSEDIRRDAVTCALAGIAAVDPADLVRKALEQQPVDGNVRIVAVGKAAASMAAAAAARLGAAITDGVLIAPDPVTIDAPIRCFAGGHPVPNERGAAGARAIEQLARDCDAGDTLLCLVSGGASSLMTLPAEPISVDDMASTTSVLLRSGATIQELNCVRKHLDRLKGGRLAAIAFPARTVALVLSDVVGDDLATIASGPTVPDPSTIDDAIAVLNSRHIWDQVPAAVRDHLAGHRDESPKAGDARLALAESRVVGSNVTATDAACAQARAMGYAARVVTTSLTGEASDVGAMIVGRAREVCAAEQTAVALIYGGEPTVTVRGPGKGGRNQELVLGSAIAMDGVADMAVASLGTDGIDGPTDVAGAAADGGTVARARAMNLDPADALAANDSYRFWKALGSLVRTGPTGTNVMDIVVVLARPAMA